MKRKNKTYKSKLTKYRKNQKEFKTLLTLFLALLFTLSTYSAITSTINSITNKKQDQAIETLKANYTKAPLLIKDISLNNSNNFRLAHLASAQACQKHGLATTTQNGLSISQCVSDLLAMMATETGASFNFNARGDNNLSNGLLQINSHYHPTITLSQAQDPFFSADWTLARMINYGYKTNRDRAIMKHNGTPNTPNTLNYLNKVNAYALLLKQ